MAFCGYVVCECFERIIAVGVATMRVNTPELMRITGSYNVSCVTTDAPDIPVSGGTTWRRSLVAVHIPALHCYSQCKCTSLQKHL